MTWKRLAVLIVLPLMVGVAIAQNDSKPAPPASGADVAKPASGFSDAPGKGAQVDVGTYIIGPNDVLNVEVFGAAELTRPYYVRPDGILTIPFVGELKASGLTPLQLEKQFKEALLEKYRDPEVSITVWEVRSKTYQVTGEVKKPATYPLIKTTTVFDAINEAGGFADVFANETDIQILRNGGKDHLKFNYKDFVKGKNRDKNKNIELENGDVVVVK